MREGKFFENKKESTNTFIERDPSVEKEEFDKAFFDYQKQRQRRRELAKLMGVAEYVKEHSPRQEKIIFATLQAAEEVVNQYSQRQVRLSKTNIFLIRKEDAERRFGADEDEAGRSSMKGGVFVYTAPNLTDSKLARFTAHELVHHAAFQRSRVVREAPGKPLQGIPDRAGLAVGHPQKGFDPEIGGNAHFIALNEAVTEQIAIEIVALIRKKTKFLESDYEILKRVYDRDSAQFSLGKDVENPKSDEQYSWSASYEDRVDKLRLACHELHDMNPERFTSAQEVFCVFAEAYFSGKLLTLARLIEKNYGKGAFRFLADYENHEWDPS
ncbi:MAG: hypothetical protein WAT81_01195 [Candidatus Moraniibacteriota bacterium]